MKKLILTAALLIAGFTTSLFAIEWGGVINNTSNVSTSDFKSISPFQSNGLYFWANSYIDKAKTMQISGELLYKYNFMYRDGEVNFANVADMDLLKFAGKWAGENSYTSLDVGRFAFSDKTGTFFVQNSDGISFRFEAFKWGLGLYAGYTGLLNSLNVIMTDASVYANTQFYNLCYGYVPAILDFQLNNLGKNTLGFQAAYFYDVTGKNALSKFYGSLSANGFVGSDGAYTANAVIGFENNFKDMMMAANLDFTFYFGGFSLVSAGIDYTSGANGIFVPFKTITFNPIHNSGSVDENADVIVPRLTGIVLFNNGYVTMNEKIVTSLENKKFKFNGSETVIGAVYNVFSDLQLGGSVGVYVDFVNKENNNFNININASMSF